MNTDKSNNYDLHKIENAIVFLVNSIISSGHNPKPVIFHSIRVAVKLFDEYVDQDIIISALLHDVIEDTDVTESDIKKEFGSKIASYVKTLTFDKSIADELKRAENSFIQSQKLNNDILMIRALDLMDNSDYYHYASDPLKRKILHDKYKLFMDISAGKISSKYVNDRLNDCYEKNVKSLI